MGLGRMRPLTRQMVEYVSYSTRLVHVESHTWIVPVMGGRGEGCHAEGKR